MARPYTDLSERALQLPERQKRLSQHPRRPPATRLNPSRRPVRETRRVCHNAAEPRWQRAAEPSDQGPMAEDAPGVPGEPSVSSPTRDGRGGQPDRMLRLLHTADVHLGARHADLGDQAAAQRERQFAAFAAAVDLALAERVDLFLVAGDLFDSNVQPRRSVERVGHELGRLVKARIRAILAPGTHDVYDRASVYRAYDLPGMAGSKSADPFVTLLTPDRPWVHVEALDAIVHGP